MSPPLFSTPAIGEQQHEVKVSFERLISELSREGLVARCGMVPLYDDGEPVKIVAGESESQVTTTVVVAAPSWQNLLTVTLELERRLAYRIHGTASCDMHLQAGANWETVEVRVNDGTNTLHSLWASSNAVEQYVPITVPFTLEVESTASLSFTMDVNLAATAGAGPPDLDRMRLIVVATPIFIEGAGG